MKPLKKRLTILFLIGFVLLALMLLMQTFSNKYAGLTYASWLWLLVLYLPPLVLLFKSPSRAKESAFIPLTLLTILFVLCSLLGILLQPFALDAWGTPNQGAYITRTRALLSSLYFLVPLEILILFLIRKNFISEMGPPLPPSVPTAFISYNHKDHETAHKIQKRLEAASIEVIIDHEDMEAGENIESFIQDSIMGSTVTISLISNASLSSGWVAMETIDTFFLERYLQNRKFIACYLEDDFFGDGFVIETIKKIDGQIKEKLRHKSDQDALGIDSRNFNAEITRLRKLRNNLDAIVSRLKSSLCLNISENQFEVSMQQLIKDIRSN